MIFLEKYFSTHWLDVAEALAKKSDPLSKKEHDFLCKLKRQAEIYSNPKLLDMMDRLAPEDPQSRPTVLEIMILIGEYKKAAEFYTTYAKNPEISESIALRCATQEEAKQEALEEKQQQFLFTPSKVFIEMSLNCFKPFWSFCWNLNSTLRPIVIEKYIAHAISLVESGELSAIKLARYIAELPIFPFSSKQQYRLSHCLAKECRLMGKNNHRQPLLKNLVLGRQVETAIDLCNLYGLLDGLSVEAILFLPEIQTQEFLNGLTSERLCDYFFMAINVAAQKGERELFAQLKLYSPKLSVDDQVFLNGLLEGLSCHGFLLETTVSSIFAAPSTALTREASGSQDHPHQPENPDEARKALEKFR